MNQSKLNSFIESCTNVAIGFGFNFIANMFIMPLVGFNITVTQNLLLGFWFTVISIIRSYLVRRYFNTKT